MISFFRRILSSKGVDKGIYFATAVLSVFGIIMIGSSSIGGVSNYGFSWAMRNMIFQSVFVLGGLIIMLFIVRSFFLKFVTWRTTKFIYFIFFALMCVCYFMKEVNGSKAWIPVFNLFSVQPAEFMKIALILMLSYAFSETDLAYVVKGRFRSKQARMDFYQDKFKRCLLIPLLYAIAAFLVGVFIQRDLGTSIIIAVICFTIFMATPRTYYRKYKKIVWLGVALLAVLGGLLGVLVLRGYQMARITAWLDPLSDYFGTGYHLTNSLIAFSGGNLFGKGFGNSTQKFGYIPEAHNDFIGAIIYEELGILGLALIIIPTAFIIFRLLHYAGKVNSDKGRLILIGIATYFFLHLFINLGGVSGLIPMTGVPLLMISSGGSSTVAAFMAIGIAQAIISRYNREKYSK